MPEGAEKNRQLLELVEATQVEPGRDYLDSAFFDTLFMRN